MQYRNYRIADFGFEEHVNCITGPNGSGKTNLLDAVYHLCFTKSYFTTLSQHTAMVGTDGFRIEGVFRNGDRMETVTCTLKQGKKELLTENGIYTRIADHIGKYTAVMIAPDDLELLNGGSEERRKWLDGILSVIDKSYLEQLWTYQKVLQQRNAWLRRQAIQPDPDRTSLDYYDEVLSATGVQLYEARQKLFGQIVPLVAHFYATIAGSPEPVDLQYRSDAATGDLRGQLQSAFYNDCRLQRTTRGMHRDDLILSINGRETRQFASQGQKKSLLFAMKLAQYVHISEASGRKPILLLDDIFEKLDQQRLEALLALIRGDRFAQVLITDTHEDRVRQAFANDASLHFIRVQ